MGLGGVVDPEVNSGYHRAPLQIAPNISSAEGEVSVTPRGRAGGESSEGEERGRRACAAKVKKSALPLL